MNLEKLLFQVDMLDNVTGPVGKMQKKLDGFATYARKSFLQVGTGAAGMWAATEGITAMLGPAREMNKALQEVSSLDVSDSALKQLNNQALKYSIKYGESADAFASSAYDIQSSIEGLDGKELAAFTNSSNVLAKATKADAATITNYTGTMFGIFKNEANAMGKAKWVEQLTGQTATAVQMFKTNGMEMSGAFTSLGASATSAGINAAEQMAVLGSLQSTMSGSEAGTKYKAFLSGVGGAQDKLGLKFTDSNGKMLGMMDILTKLKGKFGNTLDVAESDALKKAFGSDEAVGMIKLLMADTDGLGQSIKKLGNVQGMSKAEQMASKMVDPFDRLSAGGRALTTVLGQSLLPVINPLVNMMADATVTMTEWADKYPNLTRWIGYGATAILGFTGILGAAAAASGVMRIATFGLGVVFGPLNNALQWSKAVWAAYSGSQWLANAALWGFPATWLVAALVGVGVAVGAVIYWWDDLTAVFSDIQWWDTLCSAFDFIKLFSPIGLIVTFFEDGFDGVLNLASSWWDALGSIFDFVKMFTPIGLIFTFFTEGFDGVFTSILAWFDTLGSGVDWFIDKLNMLPGVNLSTSSETTVVSTSPSLEAGRRLNVPPGGAAQSISNSMTQNQSSSQSIGKVVIQTEGKQDAQSLREQLLLAGA
ncbi:phage tail tape measure protein (plasmid) [Halodesulfovibrio aestuarii]|uniref:Phage tail tape measure protein, TP901 family, core region n=1 Tax=Halodesulfovibrio aestuarii TaxID=126333 RepID=A0A8G2FA74_9BACT|nr:phage tail tape measure protein [Halodesulfovibrio aestuarii]SHJ72238.1 phage tail tape measure protein, TP901 family, core region [Halodesulfovibrio aestuarii]